MADAARQVGINRPDPDEGMLDNIDLSKAQLVPHDNGMTVNLDGPAPEQPINLPFDADLTPMFTPQELSRLGSEIVMLVDQDDSGRGPWKKTYARGLKLLGLNYEDRTEPWENACGAFHPMLLESVIRFNAEAMSDLFPGAGPVKTQIVGRVTDEKERQSNRVCDDLNWLLAEKVTGYRDETDMMLFNLPMAGTTFRKWRFDKRRGMPAAEYVLPEHLIMPYTAASLESADRYTVVLPKTDNQIDALMAEGFYRKVDLGYGTTQVTTITQAKDKIEGRSNTNDARDQQHKIYEAHINWYFGGGNYAVGDPEVHDDGTHPYVISVDRLSMKVLAIRRNWKQGDPAMERQVDVIQHKYMPGFGPYGIGLINILGGLTESATSILRQLIDAGTLSNLPAGYKTKSARVKDDSTPIGPGEWRDVEVGADTLRESFFPLPYKEPSTVLHALLGNVVDEGRRIGSVADMKITDMTGQNMPVGTTLAIIERSMKVMSGVQKRLYESFKREFRVLAEIVRDFMAERPYDMEIDPRDAQTASRKTDYTDIVDVIPIADPNNSTLAQRLMIMQAIIQLSQSAPQIYDLKALHRKMITVLGSAEADTFIPPDEEVQPADPVTENMRLLTGKPVRAGLQQDHEAHIAIHMAASQDPKMLAAMSQNPSAPGILAAAAAHVQEHIAFQYRIQIEQLLGVPLPPPEEPLPADVEYELSRLVAKAAEKLLEKDKAEQQQKEILDKLEDPVIQNERRALDIKEKAVDAKLKTDADKLDSAAKDRALRLIETVIKEIAETDRSTIAVEVQKGVAATDEQLRRAEMASDFTGTILSEAGKLAQARMKQTANNP